MDKNQLQYKNFNVKDANVDIEERTFTATITRSSVDLDSEVILAKGLNVKLFKNNGIILYNHDSKFPIGTSTAIKRVGEEWLIKAKFASAEVSDRINEVYKLVKEGILKTMSIGFIADEQRAPSHEDLKMFGKKVRNIISKATLLEASIVTIPCNSDAIITGCKSLDIDPKHIIEDYIEEVDEEVSIEDIDNVDIEEEQVDEVVVEDKKLSDKDKELSAQDKELSAQDKLVQKIKKELSIQSDNELIVKTIKQTFKDELVKQELFRNGKIYW